jgi:hypothetical protein
MTNEQEVMEVYFDEAGYTGEHLNDLSQSHLMLAAVAIPADIAGEFWRRAERAWAIASKYLNVRLDEVELKGTDIYGGKGQFRKGVRSALGSCGIFPVESVCSAIIRDKSHMVVSSYLYHIPQRGNRRGITLVYGPATGKEECGNMWISSLNHLDEEMNKYSCQPLVSQLLNATPSRYVAVVGLCG